MTGVRLRGLHALQRVAAWTMAAVLLVGGVSATSSAAVAAESTQASASASLASPATSVVKTADLSKFQPGNIISDATFSNSGSMSESQIQSFLQSKVPTCQSGYVCLKDWYDTSRTTSADAMCGAYSGGVRERASTIIYKVAQACGINPQVLLVMLQKEQGLVQHTWPSDWRYTIAMGQGCPDTAACDTRYYGFFNQVYGGAWQLKRYGNPAGTSQYFTWYAPGKTWNVRYHPNESCGSAPVYIQNQATANLYYYTPYQPNAAAIRAGYGEGDGCSAYGNRNFYQYFTDWFGSTQGTSGTAGAALVQAGEPVYFVSGGVRFHVSAADYPEFTRTFGGTSRVTDSALSAYRDGGEASLFLRNSSTGEVSLLQGGSRHHFATCDQVGLWGSRCGIEMVLAGGDFTAIASGAAMTAYARLAGATGVHLIEPGKLTPLYDDATAMALNGGSMPYAATMSSTAAEKLSKAQTRFAPARLLTVAGSSRVYLPTADGQLLYVSSWARARELGVPTTLAWSDVPAVAVAGYSRGELTEFVSCDGRLHYAASGILYPVTSNAADGFAATALDAATCGALQLSKTAALDTVYVKGTAEPEVYLARSGVYRHVTSAAVLTAMNGDVWPTVLTVSSDAIGSFAKGSPLERIDYAPGSFVKSATDPRVYLATPDGRLLYLPSWSIADEFGLPGATLMTAPGTSLDAYRSDGDLSLFSSCAGSMYFAAGGRLQAVTAAAASGFAVSTLDDATCRVLSLSPESAVKAVFVQATGAPEVYLAEGGVYRHVTSMAALIRLGGGALPPVLRVQPGTVAVVPKGTPVV
jgi:hypothetical protein